LINLSLWELLLYLSMKEIIIHKEIDF
jgi:hypothetical protein